MQKTLLCGFDASSQSDYAYRRDILRAMLKYHISVDAVDVGNLSRLGNHFHLIVRSRPDIVESWWDEERAWRYKLAWPTWDGKPWCRIPSDASIDEFLKVRRFVVRARKSLSSISHFMAQAKQPLALNFNIESDRKGTYGTSDLEIASWRRTKRGSVVPSTANWESMMEELDADLVAFRTGNA